MKTDIAPKISSMRPRELHYDADYAGRRWFSQGAADRPKKTKVRTRTVAINKARKLKATTR